LKPGDKVVESHNQPFQLPSTTCRAVITKERLNRQAVLVLLVLAGVLAYTTFQWGGVVRTGRYQYLLVLGLLAMLLSLGRSQDEWSPLPGHGLRWTAVLLPAYVLLQVVPLPVAVLRVLSPPRAEAVAALDLIGAKVNFASLSVSPAATFQYFLLVCGYMVIFLLVCTLTWRFRDRRWLVIWPILGIAALESGLGLWQYFGGTGEQVRWGTYANHNHYAGFLEMSLPFAVMYPVAVLRRAHSRWHSSVAPALAASGVWALAVLMFAGIILSFSRMGFIATLSSLFVMGTLVLATTQLSWVIRSRRRRWVGVGMVAALVVAGFVFLPPERLIQRFAELVSTNGLTSAGRADLWAETIPLIRAYPVFGCGLGGYETVFLRFKISGVLVPDHFAHNDYLQLLAELGLVGFVIGAALAFSVVRMALHGAGKSSDPEARYFAVACVGALSTIALHSLADFNLYIPANAMLLAWIAGMTVAIGSWESTMRARERLGHPNVITAETPEVHRDIAEAYETTRS
jgi:putative inorganic carbon (hco3(-)) transporter